MTLTDLTLTADVERETTPIFERVANVIPRVEWPLHAPYVAAINRLKRERNAVILAHNYQVPEIYHTVADIVGDSLALAMRPPRPMPTSSCCAACTLWPKRPSSSIRARPYSSPICWPDARLPNRSPAADVRLLRETYPGVPVVTYVNTSAAVKAESDVCVTSGNAVEIVEALNVPRVIFLPDEYLAKYVASKTTTEIIAWKGHCEVHERFTGADIRRFREGDPTLVVIAHPECPPDVLAEADYVGSTHGMVEYVGAHQQRHACC